MFFEFIYFLSYVHQKKKWWGRPILNQLFARKRGQFTHAIRPVRQIVNPPAAWAEPASSTLQRQAEGKAQFPDGLIYCPQSPTVLRLNLCELYRE